MTVKRNMIFTAIAIISILLIAMGLSLAASTYPDGLEKVAENLGFIDSATDILPEGFFLVPDYAVRGIGSGKLQTSLAGLSGILIIFALFGLAYLIYRAANLNKTRKK
jgi:cobalt/nickel transport system permease protein